MTFTALLCHSAEVLAETVTVRDGRRYPQWTVEAVIPCRFTMPAGYTVSPPDGIAVDELNARIYTGPELADIVRKFGLPLRFATTAAGWEGTYELRTLPSVYFGDTAALHHGECTVTRVSDKP